jgi:two-component system, LytTR family, sensor kinase
MSISLPKYTSKDYIVLALVLLPVTILVNIAIFGSRYFTSNTVLLFGSLITAGVFAIYFTICGGVAVLMKARFPAEHQVSKRLVLMVFSFLLMSGLVLLVLFNLYVAIPSFNYIFDEDGFVWAYFILGIINVFLTFLHEAIARYESWKLSLQETDQAYRQSRLQGLKSQVNPHFLFNSLNSLSSLISEDEEAAEKFLDEMSKVYRYMLRNDDDELVPLSTELKFVESYTYLLKSRYGTGLQVNVQVNDAAVKQCLPPLTLKTSLHKIQLANLNRCW